MLDKFQIKKFRDALAKHSPDRCSLGPTKGLEEKELIALASNKDLNFKYAQKPDLPTPIPAKEEIVPVVSPSHPNPALPLPLPLPTASPKSGQGSEEKTLVGSGRWTVSIHRLLSTLLVQFLFVLYNIHVYKVIKLVEVKSICVLLLNCRHMGIFLGS